jgi:hypothetical protein
MHLPRALALIAAAALLISASPSASAATGGPATSAGKWTATEAPLPANADHTYAQLSAVSCPTKSACTAVGSYTGSAGWQGLLLTKASRKWSAVQAPLPAGAAKDPYVALNEVNCFSASTCAAIGFYADPSGNLRGVLLTGAGSSWTAVNPPLPSNAASGTSADPSAVFCRSATSCLAVGTYEASAGGDRGLLLTGFGTRWTATQLPLPANSATVPDIDLTDMTCTASGCVVVGVYLDASSHQEGLLLTGSGSSWTATEAPLPANAYLNPSTSIEAVRCQSLSLCTAVGDYTATSGGTQGMLITGSGTSWAATEAPPLANANDFQAGVTLAALACPDASECLAAGEYQTSNLPASAGLLVTGSGSSWTTAQAPQPGNASTNPSPSLTAVACTSANACVASGYYGAAAGNDRGLLIYGGASSWTAIQAPVPRNAAGTSDVPAVSCAKGASACVAVGWYDDKSGNEQGLLVTGPPCAREPARNDP